MTPSSVSAVDDQRVVAGRLERVGEAGEHADVVVVHQRGLAVHDLGCPDHVAPVHLTHALHAEADAEDREVTLELLEHAERHAGIVGRARAGRDQDSVGSEGPDAVEVDLVVAADDRCRPQLPEVLHEDVDERVVVVDDEDRRRVLHRSPTLPTFWLTNGPVTAHLVSQNGRERK